MDDPRPKNISYLISRLRLKLSPRKRKIFRHEKPEDRFTEIYKNNYWRNDESRSGSGSTLASTENLRKELPELFREYDIRHLLDAPCGDFNWMSLVIEETGIRYTGGDIVAPLIDDNSRKFSRENIAFKHLDISKGPLPTADLMMVRDCLFHLSYRSILDFLKVFSASEIPLLLTTTHLNRQNAFENKDIPTGHFRNIDLFSAPFSFSDPKKRIMDNIAGEHTRDICLFTRSQIAQAAETLESYLE